MRARTKEAATEATTRLAVIELGHLEGLQEAFRQIDRRLRQLARVAHSSGHLEQVNCLTDVMSDLDTHLYKVGEMHRVVSRSEFLHTAPRTGRGARHAV